MRLGYLDRVMNPTSLRNVSASWRLRFHLEATSTIASTSTPPGETPLMVASVLVRGRSPDTIPSGMLVRT